MQLKSNFEDTQTKVQADDTFKYSNIGLENELCPEGTIPVQRTTKEDLIRANRVSNPFASILTKDDRGSHVSSLLILVPHSCIFTQKAIGSNIWIEKPTFEFKASSCKNKSYSQYRQNKFYLEAHWACQS